MTRECHVRFCARLRGQFLGSTRLCWTELGAEHVGLIQSLISTCKLHGINPNTYLTDVLHRISIHPASQVAELTPRLWKEKFAERPLRSVLQSKTENKK